MRSDATAQAVTSPEHRIANGSTPRNMTPSTDCGITARRQSRQESGPHQSGPHQSGPHQTSRRADHSANEQRDVFLGHHPDSKPCLQKQMRIENSPSGDEIKSLHSHHPDRSPSYSNPASPQGHPGETPNRNRDLDIKTDRIASGPDTPSTPSRSAEVFIIPNTKHSSSSKSKSKQPVKVTTSITIEYDDDEDNDDRSLTQRHSTPSSPNALTPHQNFHHPSPKELRGTTPPSHLNLSSSVRHHPVDRSSSFTSPYTRQHSADCTSNSNPPRRKALRSTLSQSVGRAGGHARLAACHSLQVESPVGAGDSLQSSHSMTTLHAPGCVPGELTIDDKLIHSSLTRLDSRRGSWAPGKDGGE